MFNLYDEKEMYGLACEAHTHDQPTDRPTEYIRN